MSSLQFELNLNTWEKKKSLADYTPEEIERNERLITESHIKKQKLSAELQHYQNIKDSSK